MGRTLHELFLECRDYILAALIEAMARRPFIDDWVGNEREAVASAANGWAQRHGYERRVTVEDVERIEVRAVGHVDYASKLALYIAEYVTGQVTFEP